MIFLLYNNVSIMILTLCTFFQLGRTLVNKLRFIGGMGREQITVFLSCCQEYIAFGMKLIISNPGLSKYNFFMVHDAVREKVNPGALTELDLSSSLLENVASGVRES